MHARAEAMHARFAVRRYRREPFRVARRSQGDGGISRKVVRRGGSKDASKDARVVPRVARPRRLRRPRVRNLAFAREGGKRATGFPPRLRRVPDLALGGFGGGFLAVLRGVDGAGGASPRAGLDVAKAPARHADVVRDRARGFRAPGAAQGARRRRRRASPRFDAQVRGQSLCRVSCRSRRFRRHRRRGGRDAREVRRGGGMARATREARGVLGAGSSGGVKCAVSRRARRRRQRSRDLVGSRRARAVATRRDGGGGGEARRRRARGDANAERTTRRAASSRDVASRGRRAPRVDRSGGSSRSIRGKTPERAGSRAGVTRVDSVRARSDRTEGAQRAGADVRGQTPRENRAARDVSGPGDVVGGYEGVTTARRGRRRLRRPALSSDAFQRDGDVAVASRRFDGGASVRGRPRASRRRSVRPRVAKALRRQVREIVEPEASVRRGGDEANGSAASPVANRRGERDRGQGFDRGGERARGGARPRRAPSPVRLPRVAMARGVVQRVRRSRLRSRRVAEPGYVASCVLRLASGGRDCSSARGVRAPRGDPPRQTHRARVRVGAGDPREPIKAASKLRREVRAIAERRVDDDAELGDSSRVCRMARSGGVGGGGSRAGGSRGARSDGAREKGAPPAVRPRVAAGHARGARARRRRRRGSARERGR